MPDIAFARAPDAEPMQAGSSAKEQRPELGPCIAVVERELRGVLDGAAVLAGSAVGDAYRGDATDTKGPAPALVLRPADTAGVAAVLSTCHRHHQPLVVQAAGPASAAARARWRARFHYLSSGCGRSGPSMSCPVT